MSSACNGRPCPFGPGRLPALVATDLDGTIYKSRQHMISLRVRRALFAAEDAGVPVAIVTGRPPRWLPPVLEASELEGRRLYGAAILANGALVVDLPELKEHAAHRFMVGPVLNALLPVLPGAWYAAEAGGDAFLYTAGWPRPVPHEADRELSLDELAQVEAIKFLARADDIDADRLLELASGALTGIAEPTISGIGSVLEVSAPGVNKGSTLAQYCAERGICPSDVIAFGDMPNDRDMLAVAGWSVAIGEAHPLLLELADEHAPSIDDDGVAVVLERIFGA